MAESLSRNLRSRHAEQLVLEVESVALRLFEARGFAEVTVEELAGAAGISPRTFYRHFPTKEDVFLVRIDQRSGMLRKALAARSAAETPLSSLRQAYLAVVADEDEELWRRWMILVESSPSLVRTALGGIHLEINTVIAEFFARRLGQSADALLPSMLAAAAGGVLLAANTRWLLEGGSLAERIGEGLEVLDAVVDLGAAVSRPGADGV